MTRDRSAARPFMCAPTDIASYRADGQCGKETPTSLNFPQFLRFDIRKNEIAGERPNGAPLLASIDKVQHVEQRLVLQGTENGIMWGVLIVEDTGDMTLTGGGEKIGFVAFGACTPD
jgi:hypothetical protein